MLKIRRAAVLGAGVMGAQIAGHLAAAGIRTYLLDLPSDAPPDDPKLKKLVGARYRSARSLMAIEQMKALKPAPLMSATVLPNIIPGNFEDDMSVLADVDWVIEAVVERMDIKKPLLAKIAEHARPHIPVTTNTSGLSLAAMIEDLPDHFGTRFFGTHFFNPPRYMKLLEVVPHAGVDISLVRSLSEWIEARLGKGIVVAKDTINFIANRIGVYNLQVSMQHMADLGINIETVDALTGKLIGHPSSATFRTIDVVGLDTFAHTADNVLKGVPSDPFNEVFKTPDWLRTLIDSGRMGQKTDNVGCFKKTKDERGRTKILAYRPDRDEYVEQEVETFGWMNEAMRISNLWDRLGFIFEQSDKGATYLWRCHRDVMAYSALLLDEIANDSPKSLDEAMKWGFNWELGPFEMWQGVGFDKLLGRMKEESVKLPGWAASGVSFYKPSPNAKQWELTGPTQQWLPNSDSWQEIPQQPHRIKLPRHQASGDERLVFENSSASLVDIGHGIACLDFHSKMNTVNDEITEMIARSVAKVNDDFQALVIANDGDHFSAGADLKQVMICIEKEDYDTIDRFVRNFQATLQLVKYAPFPSISCPHGLVLGGGCEVALHTSERIVAGESYIGLVEIGVGLLPAGGGTKELALRAYDYASNGEGADPMPFLQRAFLLIGMAKTSTSGMESFEMGLLPKSTTSVSLSRDHQVHRAKAKCLEMLARGYVPPSPVEALKVVGDPGIQTFKMMLYNMVQGGQVSEHDALIATKVATVLCGGEVDGGSIVSEQYLLDLERNAFIELCKTEKTRARIEHMLKTGKPLRN